jgi:hypothetical protein
MRSDVCKFAFIPAFSYKSTISDAGKAKKHSRKPEVYKKPWEARTGQLSLFSSVIKPKIQLGTPEMHNSQPPTRESRVQNGMAD